MSHKMKTISIYAIKKEYSNRRDEGYDDIQKLDKGTRIASLSSVSNNMNETDLSSSLSIHNVYEIFGNPSQQFVNFRVKL